MIDAGINLTSTQFQDYIPTMIQHSKEAEIEGWITISNSYKDWEKNLNFCARDDLPIWMTCGIHPHSASSYRPYTSEKLLNFSKHNEVVAIGECGIDYKRMFSKKEDQLFAFEAQLEVASLSGKPVYLHCRNSDEGQEAHEDFLRLLKQAKTKNPSLTGLVHCFTSTLEDMKSYLDLGFYIGVTGWICDNRRNQSLKAAMPYLPPEKLILETDSPFCSCYKYARKWGTKRNQPDALWEVAEYVSSIWNWKVDDVATSATKNTKSLFRL